MATTDRNLLFGVLALQMDFVGREGLVGAMNAWVLEKSRPLGSILVERGPRPDPSWIAGAAGGRPPRPPRRRPCAEPRRTRRRDVRPRRARAGGRRRRAGQPRATRRPDVAGDLRTRRLHADVRRGDPLIGRHAVPGASPARPGRAGRGLRRPRRGAGPRGRAQGDPGRQRRRPGQPRPVRAGGRDHRRPGAPRDRPGLRPGRVRRRPAVLRHAVHRGRQPQGGRSSGSTTDRPAARPGRAVARGSASCWAGSSTSATRSPTPTAGGCCTAT